jgi:putative glutamine amidotransferase
MSSHSTLLDAKHVKVSPDELRRPIIAVTYSSAEFGDPLDSLPWQLAFRGVVAAGGVPLAIDCSTMQTRIADLVELADGLILLGGVDVSPVLYGGDPSDPTVGVADRVRDENELAALEAATYLGRPTLGICRGLQLFNVSRGGTLVADLERDVMNTGSHHPGPEQLVRPHHSVEVDATSQIAKWMSRSGRIAVNSYHHQGVDAVGEHLRITSRADDGLVESLESSDGLISAVQWHPEFLWPVDPNSLALLTGFVASCQTIECAAANQSPRGPLTEEIFILGSD